MDLFRVETFEADSAGNLPDQKTLLAKTVAMAKNLEELRNAPITEPFNGPAILSGRASAVFFHEVLGHRLEGQRQRGDEEGQTFTKLLGKPILPDFLSVSDDPTLTNFNGTPLSGHYSFDDEGQPARRVDLIKDGVLETFLMSRQPIASFSTSNGHGRSETGHMPTGRQGNLIVTSSKSVTDAELRAMLIAEAKKQNKPYGLYFEDISSGFAVTTRRSPVAERAATTRVDASETWTAGTGPDAARGASDQDGRSASASASSRAEPKRSSGAFPIARRTTSSSAAGAEGHASRRRGGSSRTILATTAKKSSPPYGRRPAQSSKSTTPTANTSHAAVTRSSPRACSGAM